VSAIAAGYLGLLSFFPLVGFGTGILAIVFGVIALKKIGQDETLSGKGRAWFGILAGALGVLAWGFLIVTMIVMLIVEASRGG
jgi:hypothetical protein